MRTSYIIAIIAALGLGALLYFGGNTIPPKKAGEGTAKDAPHAPGPPEGVTEASTDSIFSASRKALPAHAAEQFAALEQQVAGLRDSVLMAPLFDSMASIWIEHKQYEMGAWHKGLAGRLAGSEKNLNFAGQLFLDLIRRGASPAVQLWEARGAQAALKESLRINPANDTVKMALATAFTDGSGETMEGVKILLELTRAQPDHVQANIMLGGMDIQSGQFAKAIPRMERVLRQEPKNKEALYLMAEAYKGTGNKKKAIELFEECKKVVNNPEFSRDIDEYINTFK